MAIYVPSQTEPDWLSVGLQELREAKSTSAGAGDAGKVPLLNASGKIDATMLPSAGAGDMLKSTYDPNDDGVIAYAQLTGVAAASHTHSQSDITNLTTDLANKANATHTHAIADVTNLQTTLDGKAASTHTHAQSDITNLVTDLAGKAASTHTHNASDINAGTVATARLGSGTANNTTYLRGDQTWASVSATITVLEGLATADVTFTSANTFYSPTGATITLTQGSWLIWAQAVMGRTATTATTYTARIRDTTNSITLAETTDYMASVNPHYFSTNLVGMKVVPSGTCTVRVEGAANQATSCVMKFTVPTNGSGTNVTTKIYALKFA